MRMKSALCFNVSDVRINWSFKQPYVMRLSVGANSCPKSSVWMSRYTHQSQFVVALVAAPIFYISRMANFAQIFYSVVISFAIDVIKNSFRPSPMHKSPNHPVSKKWAFLDFYSKISVGAMNAGRNSASFNYSSTTDINCPSQLYSIIDKKFSKSVNRECLHSGQLYIGLS